jgi:hypothetical protein
MCPVLASSQSNFAARIAYVFSGYTTLHGGERPGIQELIAELVGTEGFGPSANG